MHQQKVIAKALSTARRMGTLSLAGLGLTQAPEELWRFSALVPSADDKWWELCELRRLDLSRNAIAALLPPPPPQKSSSSEKEDDEDEESGCAFPELRAVNLSHNQLSAIAEPLLARESLAFLDVTGNRLSELPAGVSACKVLTELRAAANALTSLPPALPPRLACLVVAENALAELPDAALAAVSATLRTLDASGNRIVHVPLALGAMRVLEELLLSRNAIAELPALDRAQALVLLDVGSNALSTLPRLPPSLRELRADHNRLAALPDAVCACCPALRTLDLHNNAIASVPDTVSQLRSLVRLDLSNNALATLNPHVGLIEPLVAVALAGNPLKRLRSSGGLLDSNGIGGIALKAFLKTRLVDASAESSSPLLPPTSAAEAATVAVETPTSSAQHLDFAKRRLTAIPEDVFSAAGALSLDLSRNMLVSVDDRLSSLRSLKTLNLACNRLAAFPSAVLGLPELQRLDLGGNRISAVPGADVMEGKLPELRTLVLAGNGIASFPAGVLALHGLRELDLSTNKLSAVPKEIAQLAVLATLDVSSNSLTSLPAELGRMATLQLLKIDGNMIRAIPQSVQSKGSSALLEYLRTHFH